MASCRWFAPALIRASIAPIPPDVTIVLTPSFPALPGQLVKITVLADSLASIVSRTLTIDGQPLELSESGRASFTPAGPGKFVVEATAASADGRIGGTTRVLAVRDPADDAPPVVRFAQDLDHALLTTATPIVATVEDLALDQWVLELARFQSNTFQPIASGDDTFTNASLTVVDPSRLENGAYRMRLTARDIEGRTSSAEITVEFLSASASGQFAHAEIDLSVTLGERSSIW